jgi:hypothetical protein
MESSKGQEHVFAISSGMHHGVRRKMKYQYIDVDKKNLARFSKDVAHSTLMAIELGKGWQ